MDTGIPFFFRDPVLALRDHTLRDHNACSRKKLIGPRMVSVRYYLFTPFPKITILPPEL